MLSRQLGIWIWSSRKRSRVEMISIWSLSAHQWYLKACCCVRSPRSGNWTEERGIARWLLAASRRGETCILLHGVGTSRVTDWSGQRWGQRLITSVFHISGSVESPACGLSHLSWAWRESESFSSEVPCRQWLMSQISMVTFDQRSANSLISRAIINRANHIDRPLILTQENVGSGERRRKRKEGQGAQREAEGWNGSPVPICQRLL